MFPLSTTAPQKAQSQPGIAPAPAPSTASLPASPPSKPSPSTTAYAYAKPNAASNATTNGTANANASSTSTTSGSTASKLPGAMRARMGSNPDEASTPSARLRTAVAAAADAAPTADGFMSTQTKMNLADVALQLRDEQLEAKIVHYKAELATNKDLDAITAQVISDIQKMQGIKRAASSPSLNAVHVPAPIDRGALEIELIESLKMQLQRLFKVGALASVLARALGEVGRRFAHLFFESELHDKIRGSSNEAKTLRFREQALYLVFIKNEEKILKDLAAFEYASPELHGDVRQSFHDIVRDLRNGFLSRTTPELNALVAMLNEVLRTFFMRELPPAVGELSWEVVKGARLAEVTSIGAGYKLSASAFPAFRGAFERQFVRRLVGYVEDEMLERVRHSATPFRQETIRFVADPQIFSDVCEVVCDAVYDHLYNDGFLDLPGDWRARLISPPT